MPTTPVTEKIIGVRPVTVTSFGEISFECECGRLVEFDVYVDETRCYACERRWRLYTQAILLG